MGGVTRFSCSVAEKEGTEPDHCAIVAYENEVGGSLEDPSSPSDGSPK